MKRSEIIDGIISNTFWRGLCVQYVTKGGAKDFTLIDDLYQEFMLVVLETPEDKLLEIYSKGLIDLWCYRIISNMWKSGTSEFYRKYREVKEIDVDDYLAFNSDDRTEEEIIFYNASMEALNEAFKRGKVDSPKLHEMMIRIYLDVGSFRKMGREMGVNFMTCKRYVDKFRDRVKSCYYKLLMDNDKPE